MPSRRGAVCQHERGDGDGESPAIAREEHEARDEQQRIDAAREPRDPAAKPAGDRIRLMDISRARSLGWEPKVAIEEGIRDAMDWYESNRADADKRYNVFTQKQS